MASIGKKYRQQHCPKFSAKRMSVVTLCVAVIAFAISLAFIVIVCLQSKVVNTGNGSAVFQQRNDSIPEGYSVKVESLKKELQSLRKAFDEERYKLHDRIHDLHNSTNDSNQNAIERYFELERAISDLRTMQLEEIERNTGEIHGNFSLQISQLELRLQDLSDQNDLQISEVQAKFFEVIKNVSKKISQLERMSEDLKEVRNRDIHSLGVKLQELSDNVTQNTLNSNAQLNDLLSEVRRNLSSIQNNQNDAARAKQQFKSGLTAIKTAGKFEEKLKEDIRLLKGSVSALKSRVITLENHGRRSGISTSTVMVFIFCWIFVQE